MHRSGAGFFHCLNRARNVESAAPACVDVNQQGNLACIANAFDIGDYVVKACDA